MSENQKKTETAQQPASAEKSATATKEEEILQFWNEHKIFEKSLEQTKGKEEFVFYDGPPFATGLPHSGSLLSSVIKDVIPRYKTMRGYHVRRRWGWDTHGLPIESLVEKKLGLKTKKDILDIGVEKFNAAARGMVLGFVDEWQKYVERVGRWVDFENSYKTMDNSFIESVWWGIKEIHKKGKLYEGKKVLMYCPHCETPLAKAEIAMDNTYKDIDEEAVTVELRAKGAMNTSFLAWTTTPWTLPGNVALAVGADITYVTIEKKDNGTGSFVRFILAKDRLEEVFGSDEYTVVEEKKGSELVGMEYEPLFTVPALQSDTSYKVYAADFVSTEEGTGIVHTAVMYGEDDFVLGQEKGLPMVQLLSANGTYNDLVPDFLHGKYIKDAERDIKRDLEERSLMFERKNNRHSYPHCYRCDTPLIYNALSSWFVDIQSVKEKLLSENEKITWVPENLKHGRFKNIVENAPDWGISRNRFWASPLPIWKNEGGEVTVVGSLDELKEKTKKSGNAYFLMRHGQAQSNAGNFVSSHAGDENHLTKLGKEQAQETAKGLLSEKFDHIIASPYMRTKETAEIVAEIIGFPKEEIIFDARIQEIDTGEFDGKPISQYRDFFGTYEERFTKTPPGGENLTDMRQRVGEFIYETDQKYQNKKILIVTHEYVLWFLEAIRDGADQKKTIAMKMPRPQYYETGEAKPFTFVPLPHNDNYELDFHLPYIDRVQLHNEKGEVLTRIPEVVDCWVESGSMPFAEYHYPFENKDAFLKRAPGDFIAEYIAQTRTWFYYMHVLGVVLFGRRAFKNVVSTGTVLAGDGQKISKSKQNYTDPYALFDTYGADAFRFYLMSSVVMQAEDMHFRDDELKDVHNKVVNLLRNTLTFYQLYKDKAPEPHRTSTHTLDRWILARLDAVTLTATEAFDRFDTIRASRPLRDFIDDFSTWYVRRSRDRIKEGGQESEEALATMRFVLLNFSKVIAPVMPFIADEIFREVRTGSEPESVHLALWPKGERGVVSRTLEFLGVKSPSEKSPAFTPLQDMGATREVISTALKARQVANMRVRQPLASVTLKSEALKGKTEFLELIKDEVNVKEVLFDTTLEEEAVLDMNITPELKEEGEVRELMRAIQDLRKKAGLAPKDEAVLTFAEDSTLLEKNWDEISKVANLVRFEKGEVTHVERE